MEIDPKISLGNILTMVTIIISVASGAGAVIYRMSKWEIKLNMMWNWFKMDRKIDDD